MPTSTDAPGYEFDPEGGQGIELGADPRGVVLLLRASSFELRASSFELRDCDLPEPYTLVGLRLGLTFEFEVLILISC
jgi:hypothetical protein